MKLKSNNCRHNSTSSRTAGTLRDEEKLAAIFEKPRELLDIIDGKIDSKTAALETIINSINDRAKATEQAGEERAICSWKILVCRSIIKNLNTAKIIARIIPKIEYRYGNNAVNISWAELSSTIIKAIDDAKNQALLDVIAVTISALRKQAADLDRRGFDVKKMKLKDIYNNISRPLVKQLYAMPSFFFELSFMDKSISYALHERARSDYFINRHLSAEGTRELVTAHLIFKLVETGLRREDYSGFNFTYAVLCLNSIISKYNETGKTGARIINENNMPASFVRKLAFHEDEITARIYEFMPPEVRKTLDGVKTGAAIDDQTIKALTGALNENVMTSEDFYSPDAFIHTCFSTRTLRSVQKYGERGANARKKANLNILLDCLAGDLSYSTRHISLDEEGISRLKAEFPGVIDKTRFYETLIGRALKYLVNNYTCLAISKLRNILGDPGALKKDKRAMIKVRLMLEYLGISVFRVEGRANLNAGQDFSAEDIMISWKSSEVIDFLKVLGLRI